MNPLNFADHVHAFSLSRAYNLTNNGIPRGEFKGNFEWRDSMVTFALKDLDANDIHWIASCGVSLESIEINGRKVFRYVSELTRTTGIVLIDPIGGRAAFPIFESPDSDVIMRFDRLLKVKFINLIIGE